MSNIKKLSTNIILIGIISVLTLTLLLGLFIRAGQGKFDAPSEFFAKNLGESTSLVTIANGANPLNLVKQANGWDLKSPSLNFMADSDTMKSMLDSLKTIKFNRLVSKSEEANKKLGFGDATKTLTVDFSDGAKSLGAYTLTTNPSAQGEYFIQKQGSQEVYSIGGLLTSYLSRSPSDWVNKRLITSIKSDDIDQFSVKSKEGTATFQRASDKKAWSGSGALNANKATATEITPLLNQIVSLTATKVETLAKADFEARIKDFEEHYVVSINGKEVFKLLAAKTKDADYVAVFARPVLNSEGKVVVYTLARSTVGELKVTLPQLGINQPAQ